MIGTTSQRGNAMKSEVEQLARAVQFLDQCKADISSGPTGAMRDAHEWVEESARAVVAASPSLAAEHEAFEAWWPNVGQTIGKVAAWEAWKARAGVSDSSDPITAYYADRANSGQSALTGN